MSDQRSTPGEPLPPLGSATSGSDLGPGTGNTSGTGSTSGVSGSGSVSTPPAPSGGSGQSSGRPKRQKRGADDPLRRSRTSGLWFAVVGLGLLLILLIIFIVQNTQRVKVDFLGWSGSPPLAVALLVAAAAGILITGLVGTLRILQLRRRFKRADK